jgi:transposase
MIVGAVKASLPQEFVTNTVTTIGLDIAKSVFQVHGIDAQGKVVIRRQLRRRYVLTFFEKPPPCLVGFITSLVARTASARAYSALDAGRVCETLRQATKERCN